MKLQTIIYAVIATTSIGTSAKSIRGGNNHKIDDENANTVNPSNVDELDSSNIDEPDSDGNLHHQQQQPQRDLHARHIPYRMFAEGVDPEFRDAEEGGPSQPSSESSPSSTTSNGILSRFDNLFSSSKENEVDPDTRIIGGSQASNGEFPYSVSMQDNIGHFCGGSLIAPNLVLTAAHCLGGSYDVVIGRTNLNSNSGESIRMSREIKHPNYNPSTTNNDFAILVLQDSVSSPDGKMVKLNTASNYPSVGSSTTVMGYGDTTQSDFTSQLSDKLMKVNVNVISNSDCDDSSDGRDDYYDQITSQMICARVNGGGKDACQGDSGGPLVVQTSGTHTQVGVVSWGIGCATAEFPGVYARVSSAYNWIRDEVCDRADNPPSWYNCPGSGGSPTPPTPPTPTPPSPSPPSPSPPTPTGPTGGGAASDPGNWRTVMSESFSSGMGKMKKGGDGAGNDARWFSSAKFRNGVLKLQNKGARASVSSNKVDVKSYNKCRVSSSFMTVGFESGDKFCFDFSYNNSSWNQAMCVSNSSHNGKRWWDNQKTGSFSVKNKSDLYIRIRMVGNSRKDDVLIDEADVECSK